MDDDGEFAWMAWGPEDVGNWIENSLGVPHGITFKEKQIDGPTLLELEDDDLRRELGVSDPIHRKKITGHIKVLRIRRLRLAQMSSKQQANHSTTNGRDTDRKRPQSARGPSLDEDSFKGGDTSGRSESARPARKSSGNSDRYMPPSPQAQARTLSRDHSMASSIGNRSDETCGSNRYSRYINPSQQSTRGLSSCFGLDSPSYSVRGSFPMAERSGVGISFDEKSRDRRNPHRDGGPGPATYAAETITSAERFSPGYPWSPRAPKATIGNSSRDTSEFIIAPGTQPGSGKCYAMHKSMSKVKGGVIGSANRWHYNNGRPTPGPSSYQTRPHFLSTFK